MTTKVRATILAVLMVSLFCFSTNSYSYVHLGDYHSAGCIKAVGVCSTDAGGNIVDWNAYSNEDQNTLTGALIEFNGGISGAFNFKVFVTVDATIHSPSELEPVTYTVTATYTKCDKVGSLNCGERSFEVAVAGERTCAVSFSEHDNDDTARHAWNRRIGKLTINVSCDGGCSVEDIETNIVFADLTNYARYVTINASYEQNQIRTTIEPDQQGNPPSIPGDNAILTYTVTYDPEDWDVESGFLKIVTMLPFASIFALESSDSENNEDGTVTESVVCIIHNQLNNTALVTIKAHIHDGHGQSEDEEKFTVLDPNN